jgi:hypothetical protein
MTYFSRVWDFFFSVSLTSTIVSESLKGLSIRMRTKMRSYSLEKCKFLEETASTFLSVWSSSHFLIKCSHLWTWPCEGSFSVNEDLKNRKLFAVFSFPKFFSFAIEETEGIQSDFDLLGWVAFIPIQRLEAGWILFSSLDQPDNKRTKREIKMDERCPSHGRQRCWGTLLNI